MSALRKFVIFLAVLVVTIPVAFAGVMYGKLKSVHVEQTNDTLTKNNFKYDNQIVNILLIGTDARPGEDVSRSDSMMILTVDNKHKKLKLTSLGRDTYVNIPGHGFQKLTHAYAYGKEELLIDTIEKNFKLDLQNYAKVDFASFIDIVDAVGGIKVNVSIGELREMNKFVYECWRWDPNPNKGKLQYLKTPGEQELKGYQALAFARIRHNDGTMERDNRQRLVIETILKKVDKMPISIYPKLLNAVLPHVKTNMSPGDILSLGMSVLDLDNLNIITMQFPLHPENEVRLANAGYVIPFEQYEIRFLHDFIFDDKNPPTPEEIKEATKKWYQSGETTQYITDSDYMSYRKIHGYK